MKDTEEYNNQDGFGFNANVLLGIGASFMPRFVIQRLADKVLSQINIKHPNLSDRLKEAEGKTFIFIISDMPFDVHLGIFNSKLKATIVSKEANVSTDVVINASSQTLIALLNGSQDGDALFFSRQLEAEGDTEALLILRNALDNEAIGVDEIIYSVFGCGEKYIKCISFPFERLGIKFINDLNLVHKEALNPLIKQQKSLQKSLGNLLMRVKKLETIVAKKNHRGAI